MIVLVTCLINVLSFVYVNSESLSISTNSFPFIHFEKSGSYHIDINILIIFFYNTITRNNKDVNLYYNNQRNRVYLKPVQGMLNLTI